MIALLLLAAPAALVLPASPVGAVLPDEMLADPVLEARARTLSQELRCVVCQNQNIDDSDAPLARDLRIVVREQLTHGATDQATLDYVVARYGHFVLLKPPVEPATWALWLGPFAVLGLGGVAVALWQRRQRPVETEALSVAEADEVGAMLENTDLP